MKLFIDTANLDEIREAATWGVIDGVTTNPSLIAREGRDFAEAIDEICRLVDGPVSAEVVSQDAPAMLREARMLRRIHPNVVIKVPMTVEGVKAVSELSREGTPTNVTLVFTPVQAMLAAKAGATYVSPFVGRIDDQGGDGIQVIRDIVELFDTHCYDTEVLSASIRHAKHVLDSAMAGAHVATCPFKVLQQVYRNPLTDLGNAAFSKDWASVPGGHDLEGLVTAYLDRRGHAGQAGKGDRAKGGKAGKGGRKKGS